VSFGSSKRTAEGEEGSVEETDTTIDNPLFRATEPARTATFGPAVNRHAPIEEPTDATVPRPEPTAPMIRRTVPRRSWTVPTLAIGALLGLALLVAYASCR
jgi:hypothetical protein